MAHQIWLSFPLNVADPRPPAIPAPELAPLMTIAREGAEVQILRVASHTGTHVDAPQHVIDGGVRITDFSPDELYFTAPVVIDLPLGDEAIVLPEHLLPWEDRLRGADIALFRFGYTPVRSADPARYSLHAPGFGVEAARWLRAHAPGLRAIGLDVPSLACIAALDETMTAHHELLGGEGCRFLVIEDMDLGMDLTNLHAVRLCPWLVTGMDSGPCSVIGVLNR